ncbi:MAG: gliding motility-associated C-terminal domain-containing protein [Flavobacteriales bacterium]|nr:gliding motility-associated C-terminal domain-containing protein [Flavobacteriales bacterium]
MRSTLGFILFAQVTLGQAQEPCAVELSIDPPTCAEDADGSITLIPGAGGPFTFEWSHDTGLNGPQAAGLEVGSYSIVISGDQGCISFIDTVVPDPGHPPLGSITTTNISCAGTDDGTATFTVNPGPYTWEWVDDPNITNPLRTGLGAGSYTALVLGGICPSYITGMLGDPDIFINGAFEYCPASPPTLTTDNVWGFQPDIFLWSTGDVTSTLQVEPGLEGSVSLTAINSTTGCTATDEVELTLLTGPTVLFSIVDSLCIHLPTHPTLDQSDADSLIWRWGVNGNSNALEPTIMYDDPFWQPISVQGFDALGCGSLPVHDSVFVRPRSYADHSATQVPCTTLLQLDLHSTADSCALFIGDSLYLNLCSGSVQLDLRRYSDYDITFYSTRPDRCDDTASTHIDLRTEPTLFLPNAFSPDGDGANDTWPGPVEIPDNGFELLLFDRWGTNLWITRDTQAKWDGSTFPPGVYVYTMRMRDPCEPTNEVARKGIVTLVR